MKKYKVCKLINGDVISPFKNYNYGKESDLFGKLLKFDFDSCDEECSFGFYATDVDGIIYSLNKHKTCVVYEVEVGGKEKIFNKYKQRFSEATFIRRLSDEEIRTIIKEQSNKMDWNYMEACFPVIPVEIDIPFNKERALELLKLWNSVRDSVGNSVWDSVGYSVRNSVWDSVGYSVRNSVWDSVWDSVWYSVRNSVWGVGNSVRNSVWAYISSFFPNIKKWNGIDHVEGTNPFQSGIDLWNMGLVPSFDGNIWRLHKGNKMEVVLEISSKELMDTRVEKRG